MKEKKKRSETALAFEYVFSTNIFANVISFIIGYLYARFLGSQSPLVNTILPLLIGVFAYWLAIMYYSKYMGRYYRDYDQKSLFKKIMLFFALSVLFTVVVTLSLQSTRSVLSFVLFLLFMCPSILAYYYFVKKYLIGRAPKDGSVAGGQSSNISS